MTTDITLTREAGGHVATCTCGWLRWWLGDIANAVAGSNGHAEKCVKPELGRKAA